MIIKPNFKLRRIANETILVRQGKMGVDMTRVISLNASAKLLYEQLLGKDFELEDAANVLENTYGIERERAMKGAAIWIEALRECKVIE